MMEMNWKYRGMLAWTLILVLAAGFLMTGSAEGVTGSVTVNLGNHKNIKDYLAKDSNNKVEMSLFKVASLNGDDGWSVDDRYASFGVVEAELMLRGEGADNDSGIQKILENPEFEKTALGTQPIATAIMDDNGNIRFSGLELGIYYGVMTQGPEGLLVQFLAPLPFQYLGLKLNDIAVNAKVDEKVSEPTPTPTTVPKVTPTATAKATPTVTPRVTATTTPRVTATATPRVTATTTPRVTATTTPRRTATTAPTPYNPVVPGGGGGGGGGRTPSPAPTRIPTATPTVTPTVTPTATPTPETVTVSGRKIWVDNNNEDGMRPASVTIHLLANGTTVQTVTASAANGWSWSFTNLDKLDQNGNEIVYSITEDNVPAGYTSQVNGYNVTNTYQREETSATVRKVWNDNNNELGRRPASITATLSNGMQVVLSEANGWSATIDHLPVYRNGQKIEYTWTEHEALGYTLTGSTTSNGVTTLTNTLWQRPEPPEGKTVPPVPGVPVEEFDDYNTPLGIEVIINHVGDCFD